MPRPLTVAIEDESRKERLRVYDLLKVKFPLPIGQLYWGNKKTTWDGNEYLHRVLTVGSWTRSMNPESEDLSITLGNTDGEITRICNLVDPELAELTLIRVYPDINEAIDPMWTGYGGTMELNEETAEWGVHFGFRGFTQKGMRTISQNCWKKFADGKYCPYTGSGIGLASNLASSMGMGDEEMTVLDPNRYATGDIVGIDGEEMLITGGVGDTFVVWRGYNSTAMSSHASGTAVFHKNCPKSSIDCERRGMNGPPQGGADFRYFGGWEMKTPISFRQRAAKDSKPKYFSQSSFGNQSIQGEVIPVVWGNSRIRDVQAAASADAREFLHALFIICEGEIGGIAANLLRMNGLPPDDIDGNRGSGWRAETGDSLLLWKGTTGQRMSFGIMSNLEADTYHNNPFLFNDAEGRGPSLSDMAAVRVRIEEGGEEFSNNIPSIDVSLTGRLTRTMASYAANDPTLVTPLPNPIEVACDYLVNGKFGARLSENRIDWTSAEAESAYCQQNVTNTSTEYSSFVAYVIAGPSSSGVENSPNSWALIYFGLEVADNTLVGRTIKITQAGKEQSKVIGSNYAVAETVDVNTDNRFLRMGFFRDYDLPSGSQGIIVEIQGEWDAGKTPSNGDTVEVTGYAGTDEVPRFRFDGRLNDDDSVEKGLSMILSNCNGFYFSRGGKIVFGIRKAEDLLAINDLPVLTDHGSDRNILREDGKSSLTISKVSGMDVIANQIEVSFECADDGFQETTIFVYDEDLQRHAGSITAGDTTRIVNSKSLKLTGTATKDQAMRLGALALREEILRKDSCAFQMSLKDSITLEPGDVRRLDSWKVKGQADRQLSKDYEYIRIVSIEETDKFTASVTAHRHDNAVYDDSIHNLVGKARDQGPENPANFPRDVVPFPLVETIDYAKDGTTLSVVNIEVTYP